MELLFGIWPNSLLGTAPNRGPIVALAPVAFEPPTPDPQPRTAQPPKVRLFFPRPSFCFLFSICGVVVVLWCRVVCVFKIFVVRPRFPSAGPSSKIPSFFSPALRIFRNFLPRLGPPKICSGVLQAYTRECAIWGSRTPNAHISRRRRFKHHQNSMRRPQRERERENKSENWEWGESKKNSKFWAPSPSGLLRAAHHRTHPPPQQHPNNTPTTPPTTNTTPPKQNCPNAVWPNSVKKMAKCGQKELVPNQSFFRGGRRDS